jgi:DNA-damage-inducible protein J
MRSEKIKLQVRVDRAMMAQAETVFEALGIDSTVAVRMFFRRVVATRGIPFSMRMAEPEFSPEQQEHILAAWEESKDPANLEGPFESAEELMRDLRRPRSRRKKATA